MTLSCTLFLTSIPNSLEGHLNLIQFSVKRSGPFSCATTTRAIPHFTHFVRSEKSGIIVTALSTPLAFILFNITCCASVYDFLATVQAEKNRIFVNSPVFALFKYEYTLKADVSCILKELKCVCSAKFDK